MTEYDRSVVTFLVDKCGQSGEVEHGELESHLVSIGVDVNLTIVRLKSDNLLTQIHHVRSTGLLSYFGLVPIRQWYRINPQVGLLLEPAKLSTTDELSAESRALAILATYPKLSLQEIADKAVCTRQYLSNKEKCPLFQAAWKVAQEASAIAIPRGQKAKDGTLEAWKSG